VRPANISIALLSAAATPLVPACAAPRVTFNIAAGTLGDALIALAQQANITVGINDSALGRLRTPEVRGRLEADAALRRLLKNLPAKVEQIDSRTWRIFAAATPRLPIMKTRPPAPLSPVATGEIIVTGSKTGASFDRYAGTANIVEGGELTIAEASAGSDALVQRLPALTQTHLGSGRNKLFIRGVADSSFNGPSQATVGEYLGDVRLNYNAPDPDLSLYDINSVEVIEGPQGTLYGVGALGGIIRVVPRPVDLSRTEGELSIGQLFTRHGAGSEDIVGVFNLSLASGVAGLRLVAFDTVEGGYIDDRARGLKNVNRTKKSGGRIALRWTPGPWRIDAGAIVQNITARDGQYTDRIGEPLSRSSRVAQPFDNDYSLAHLTVSRDWGRLSFISATGLIHQSVDSRFDFTAAGAPSPRVFDQGNRINLISNETRLSRRDSDGAGWVVGTSLLHDEERLTRALGELPDPPRILGLSNSVTEGALFGEAGIHLLPHVVGTIGGRIEYACLVGRPLDQEADDHEPKRNEVAFLPSLSLAWRPREHLQIFTRYQEGFRPGGLSVSPGAGKPLIQRFQGDNLASIEAGAKFAPSADRRWEATVTVSHAHWENVQADLVDTNGLPFTANIGTGRIWGIETQFAWRPAPKLRLSSAIFANDSRLTDPAPDFVTREKAELPNVAHVGIRVSADYEMRLGGDWRLEAGAAVRYVGHSRLGVGAVLDLPQGNYTLGTFSARLGTSRWGLSLNVENLFDSHGNTFALGNPFQVIAGDQRVPLRPRTIRFGLDAHF
jgi:iron complex outermembrane recepter protein